MNIWGGGWKRFHRRDTLIRHNAFRSCVPQPEPSIVLRSLYTANHKLSFEWLLAFIPNLTPKANTGGEGTRTSQKHEFARHRYLRCLCILVQPLPITWQN